MTGRVADAGDGCKGGDVTLRQAACEPHKFNSTSPNEHQAVASTITSADWLQAASGIVGVALTIWAAVWIEGRKRNAAEREDRRRLRQVITEFKNAAGDGADNLPTDPTDPIGYDRSIEIQNTLLRSIARLAFVTEGATIKDLDVWEAVSLLNEQIASEHATLTNERDILIRDGHHSAVFNVNRSKVSAAATRLLAPIDRALLVVK